MPVLSKKRRRVGLDSRVMSTAKQLTDANQTAEHLSADYFKSFSTTILKSLLSNKDM
jgi:hypothetical protein